MKQTQLAAQLYTLRDYAQTEQQLDETLAKVAVIGYRAVQVSGIGPIAPEAVKRLVDKHNLQICATHFSYDSLVNSLDDVISSHLLWDCKYVGIGSMPPSFRNDQAGYVAFTRQMNDIGKRLSQHELQFVYHNHKFEFERFNGETGMDWILNEADERDFHFELDTYWVQAGGGDPAAWIRKLQGRMKVIHLKDMEIISNEQIYAEVGSGNMNWDAILKACRDIGIEWYVVEQDVCRRDPFESLEMSYRYLLNRAERSE